MTKSPFTRPVTRYVIRIEAHHIAPRFDIPASEVNVYAASRVDAVVARVREVARDAGCGLWKPWLREIAEHTEIVDEVVEEAPIA